MKLFYDIVMNSMVANHTSDGQADNIQKDEPYCSYVPHSGGTIIPYSTYHTDEFISHPPKNESTLRTFIARQLWGCLQEIVGANTDGFSEYTD